VLSDVLNGIMLSCCHILRVMVGIDSGLFMEVVLTSGLENNIFTWP
jgi:hypothetical protein